MKLILNKYYLVCIAFILITFFYFFLTSGMRIKPIQFPDYTYGQFFINNSEFKIYVADTEMKRELGLSNSQKLSDIEGMLFTFATPSTQHFWMKDMNYDLDIIWIDKDWRILGISEKALASSYNKNIPNLSKIYNSPENTKYVLEINSGLSQKLNFKTGNTILNKNLSNENFQEFFEKNTLNSGLENSLKLFLKLIKSDREFEAQCHYIFHGMGHGNLVVNNNDVALTFLDIRKYSSLVTTIPTCVNGYYHGVLEEYAKDTKDKNILLNKLSDICKNIDKNDEKDSNDCYHGIGHASYIQLDNDLNKSLFVCNNVSLDEKMKQSCRTGIFMQASKNYDFDPNSKQNKIMSLSFCDTLKDPTYEAECFNQVSYLVEDLNNHKDEFIKNMMQCRKIPNQEERITCIRTFKFE